MKGKRVGRILASAVLAAVAGTQGCSTASVSDGKGKGCERLGDVEVGDEGSCPATCQPLNDEHCMAAAAEPICPKQEQATPPVDVCGVLLPAPPANAALERSAFVEEFAGSGPPDLSCLDPAGYPAPADPAASTPVTVKGFARIFSHGCQSSDVRIEIRKVVRDGSVDDGMPGALVGEALVTPASCVDAGERDEDVDECSGGRWECSFEYPGVPTETELMIVTDGAAWAPIYEYGLFIGNGDLESDGSYQKDVRALAQDDYQLIPQVAMGKTVTKGNGVIAGEVHDCGNVRLVNAVADVDAQKFITTYFTDNELNPLPDLNAKGTSALGLYASFDIAPGPVTVAAAGVLDGKLVSAGHFRLRVFPDAVSSFTFRGVRPFQVE